MKKVLDNETKLVYEKRILQNCELYLRCKAPRSSAAFAQHVGRNSEAYSAILRATSLSAPHLSDHADIRMPIGQ
jgi:hypothetical protein